MKRLSLTRRTRPDNESILLEDISIWFVCVMYAYGHKRLSDSSSLTIFKENEQVDPSAVFRTCLEVQVIKRSGEGRADFNGRKQSKSESLAAAHIRQIRAAAL